MKTDEKHNDSDSAKSLGKFEMRQDIRADLGAVRDDGRFLILISSYDTRYKAETLQMLTFFMQPLPRIILDMKIRFWEAYLSLKRKKKVFKSLGGDRMDPSILSKAKNDLGRSWESLFRIRESQRRYERWVNILRGKLSGAELPE